MNQEEQCRPRLSRFYGLTIFDLCRWSDFLAGDSLLWSVIKCGFHLRSALATWIFGNSADLSVVLGNLSSFFRSNGSSAFEPESWPECLKGSLGSFPQSGFFLFWSRFKGVLFGGFFWSLFFSSLWEIRKCSLASNNWWFCFRFQGNSAGCSCVQILCVL